VPGMLLGLCLNLCNLFLHFCNLLLIGENLLAHGKQLALRQLPTLKEGQNGLQQVLALFARLEGQIIDHLMEMLDLGEARGLLGCLFNAVLD
jgi:hypothetical protein